VLTSAGHVAEVERAGEKPAGGREIPFLRDEDVDDLTELVSRPVQIDPSSGDFDVCLIHEPSITGRVPAGSCRVDQQRCEPLRPPVHAHMIDLDVPFRRAVPPRRDYDSP
jgi:hypothetical protein